MASPSTQPISLRISIPKQGATKTLKFSATALVGDVFKDICEIVGDRENGGVDNGLFYPATGRWLEARRTIDSYDIKSGDLIEYKRRSRNLRVKTLDDTTKTIAIEDNLVVQQLVVVVCEKFGILHPDEYSLTTEKLESARKPGESKSAGPRTDSRLAYTAARFRSVICAHTLHEFRIELLQRRVIAQWLLPNKALREQGVEENELVVLKKKFFVSDPAIDRNDPVQVNLLYHQAQQAIVRGTHPCQRDEAAQLAALQCQVTLGNQSADKTRITLIKLSEYLPPDYANLGRDITAQIAQEHAKLEGMTTLNARLRYVQQCRSLKTYGVTFFAVQEAVLSQKKRDKPLDILLGVSRDSVMRMDVVTKEVLKVWPLTTLRRWTATATSFALDFGEYALSGYVAQTTEGDTISQLIAGYVDIVRRRREEAAAASGGSASPDRDGSGMGERRGSRSGLSASMSVGSGLSLSSGSLASRSPSRPSLILPDSPTSSRPSSTALNAPDSPSSSRRTSTALHGPDSPTSSRRSSNASSALGSALYAGGRGNGSNSSLDGDTTALASSNVAGSANRAGGGGGGGGGGSMSSASSISSVQRSQSEQSLSTMGSTASSMRSSMSDMATLPAATQARAVATVTALRQRERHGPLCVQIDSEWKGTLPDTHRCSLCLVLIARGQSVLLTACLHALCRQCADNMLQLGSVLMCNICSMASTVTVRPPRMHPFVEAKLSKAVEVPACTKCADIPANERLAAAFSCTEADCGWTLCQVHAMQHRLLPMFKSHSLAPLPAGTDVWRCPEHQQSVQAYCASEDCNVLVCALCLTSRHPKATHAVRLLDTAFVDAGRARLMEGTRTSRTVAAELVRRAADVRIAVADTVDRDEVLRGRITTTFAALRRILEHREQAMLLELTTLGKADRQALQDAEAHDRIRWRMAMSTANLADQLASGVVGPVLTRPPRSSPSSSQRSPSACSWSPHTHPPRPCPSQRPSASTSTRPSARCSPTSAVSCAINLRAE